MKIYTNQTSKPLTQFVNDINTAAGRRGFKINNGDKMDMAVIFTNHGIDTPETFDMHMIQLCKPEKASKSLFKNPERIVLIPKFIMAFSEGGMTQIRFLYYSEESVARLIDDAEFPKSLSGTFTDIIDIIEEAMSETLAEAC